MDALSPPASPPVVTSSLFPYSASFTDTLMSTILDDALSPRAGLTVLPPGTYPRGRASARTLRFTDLDTSTIPSIPASAVPVPLEDDRRLYTSLVPGVLLTHVGGRLEGGAPLAVGAGDASVRQFVAEHGVQSREELQRSIRKEAESVIAELRARLRVRREAGEANQRVEREVRELRAQREMERKVEEKMRREWREREDAD